VSYLRQRCQQEPAREGPPRRGFAGQRRERLQEQTANWGLHAESRTNPQPEQDVAEKDHGQGA
jgi:hypothetical protein